MHSVKLGTFLVLPVVLICLAGCGHRRSAIPDDSFRLTLTDLLASDDERVSTIRIETRENQTYSLRAEHSFFLSGGSSKTVQSAAAVVMPQGEQGLTLVAYRHAGEEGELDRGKTVIKTEYGSKFTDSRSLPQGSAATNILTLNVRDGVYPLNRPLIVGRLHGEDLLLTVGTSTLN